MKSKAFGHMIPNHKPFKQGVGNRGTFLFFRAPIYVHTIDLRTFP